MILVTGGTGLVGSHLLLDLAKSGKKVRAIYRSEDKLSEVKKIFLYFVSAKETAFLFDSIDWVQADILDIPSLNEVFTNIDYVYHCAAIVSFDAKNAENLRATNIEGTANIVNSCIIFKVKKLCHISSIATMDIALGDEYISENFTWHPEKAHSDYAISKHGAEIEVWRGTQEGLSAVIVNPGVIIGPGFWDSGSGQLFKKIDEGLKYHFPKTTGFVGVQDVSKASILLMDSSMENEQYIVVSENLSFKTILEWVAESLQKKGPHTPLEPWMVFIGWIYQSIANILWGAKKQLSKNDYRSLFEHSYYSNEKIREKTGFSFTPVKSVVMETGVLFRKEKDNIASP
ncbi:NAD-dependent epimerase/dehydratase family protein [Gillisia hiemivivida]|uniref:NAD-dependent epimerase/dehydratase family protein n=1 Tax=Gillisia hiemivivida TaxID=291190 RepID=A0A5C6ZSD5_9FLAO|nr:NAD-dependent epimerase/dehydratase family protein [Gillisia hiemivivida]TXD93722.1 NAD-dependent epimerase/dehydratase family protein [Gillisia hiemivivida]